MKKLFTKINTNAEKSIKQAGCKSTYDPYNGDYDCEYDTSLICDECKYGTGRRNPEAKCNQNKSD